MAKAKKNDGSQQKQALENHSGTAEGEIPALPIVGVGASAGGLEAYTQFLRALPADTDMAYVLISHLDPNHESKLDEILSRSSSMPVVEVEGEPLVQANHIYVIPPNRSMIIQEGHLRLMPRPQDGIKHRPIDAFLRSLAADQGVRGIAVILSGMGSDGTMGIREIKAQGGVTFAQDDTAAYNAMPRNAIASGDVDFVLPPEKIAEELVRIGQHPLVVPKATDEAQGTIADILQVLHDTMGVDFTHYKSTTLFRRISRRMLLHNLEKLPEYLEYLKGNLPETELLYRDILINVTSFFRDPQMFDTLKAQVFPKLLANRSQQDTLRIWVLGCSTGEEAYSIAMSLLEYGVDQGSAVPAQIFATDLNEWAIDKARAGLYPKSIAHDLSPDRLERFFGESDDGYRISKTIRDMCVFARQNVLSDPPFSRMDLISCRNLLIYMESSLQRKVIPLFHYALRKTGYLWLGSSESVAQFPDLFDVIDSKHKLYAKKSNAPVSHFTVPMMASPRNWAHAEQEKFVQRARQTQGTTDVLKEADRLALAKYAPAGVLVSGDHEILQFRGDTSRFLAAAPGKPNLNVLKMAREGLLVGLRSTLQQAEESDAAVRSEGLQVKSNGGFREVNLEVLRIGAQGSRGRCFLILF